MDKENDLERTAELLAAMVKRQKSTYLDALRDMGLSEAYINYVNTDWHRNGASRRPY